MNKKDKILITGANGLVGSALVRKLKSQEYENILTPTRQELDLSEQVTTLSYFQKHKPDYVFHAAAKVGGIRDNYTFGGDYILENLQIQQSVISSAFKTDVKNLLFFASSCIYPRECPQPIKEEYLLTGKLEITNEPFAISKIAGLKMVEALRDQYGLNYFSVLPCNLYGPRDNFEPESCHVVPGLINRMLSAKENNDKEFRVWGTGKALREFLYIDDVANACVTLMNSDLPKKYSYFNIGSGFDMEIGELAKRIAEVVDYKGQITFDTTKPDGTHQKVLDISRLKETGWNQEIEMADGLQRTLKWFLESSK